MPFPAVPIFPAIIAIAFTTPQKSHPRRTEKARMKNPIKKSRQKLHN